MLYVEASISSSASTVQVSAAMGSAGQALPSTVSSSIRLANHGYGLNPLQYKAAAAGWVRLEAGQGVELAVNLAETTVMVRKGSPTEANVPLRLTVNTVDSTGPASGVPLAAAAPVAISGIPIVGSKLTAVIAAGWQNAGGNWTRNGVAISGATALEYTLVSADVPGPVTYKSTNIPYIPPALTAAVAPVLPAVTVAPVLSAIAAGGVVTFTPGTYVGTPAYNLMRGSTVVAAGIASGATVAGTVADDQVFLRLVASHSAGQTAQADSNTVVVTPASSLPAGVLRIGGLVFAMDGKAVAIS